MRLGWCATNRRCQIVTVDNDEESTNSTSLVRRELRKYREQQQMPAEASSSSCTVTTTSTNGSSSGNSSLSDDLYSIGVDIDDGDDSSSSSSLPPPDEQREQHHSQVFYPATSLDDMVELTANCDNIEGDPPYENSIYKNANGGGKDRSGGRSDKINRNNSGISINRLMPQRQQKQHRKSSSSKIGNEDDDDEENSEHAVRKNIAETQQQHYGEQSRSEQQNNLETPYDDLFPHEQPMSPQHQEHKHKPEFENNKTKHNNYINADASCPPMQSTNYRGEGAERTKEPADHGEYEAEEQQQSRTGIHFSNGSNGIGKGGSDDDSIPDDDEDGDETDIEDDDDDDRSDQEVPLWKPQDIQSVCEFTHTISDYSAKRDSGCKKAEYSSTTVDNLGNKWRLIVYVNGNGRASNNHLSLFLQVADADDLPFGWKKAVSYVLTLEHPHVGAGLSYAKRNPDKTFKLCPKAIDWGWSQFITSDRIQQESFVSNDSLVVRASVTVKSSSVDIDLDDAELYLKCAVEEGRPDAVQLCLDQGASVNCQFKDDLYTPLHTACSTSPNEDGVNAALGSGGGGEHNKPNNSQSKNNNNAMCTQEGSMQVLELLLVKGADGNACNKWRETPLLIAANNGHKPAVEALLKHGADPSLCSEAGWSALTFAAHKGYGDIVELLLDDGAPVNCRVTEDNSTPLHKACAGSKPGHLEAVKLLLESQADVHALNKWRETPLLTAANHGQAGAVEQLLRAGADPCKCTDTGWSPLSIAAYKGHDEVVKLLLEEGAPTEEADPTLSALLQAATKGLPDTVELLLRHGADHTVTTKKGDTALSILVEQNLIDAAVEMVTEYKASIPRCSRDRKKIQRARLLINLRLKQQQRENGSDDDGNAESVEGLSVVTKKPNSSRKKKKKKSSAELQAKAAEEALLLELEQEDAERNKLEQEANKKSAKKRKKKERERQLKKEQEEKRQAEEKKEEEKRKKIQDAKDAAEREERELRLAAQKKKDEENRRKQANRELKVAKAEAHEKHAKLHSLYPSSNAALSEPTDIESTMDMESMQPSSHVGSRPHTWKKSRKPKAEPEVYSDRNMKARAAEASLKNKPKGTLTGTFQRAETMHTKKRGWESIPNNGLYSHISKSSTSNGTKPKIPLVAKVSQEKESQADEASDRIYMKRDHVADDMKRYIVADDVALAAEKVKISIVSETTNLLDPADATSELNDIFHARITEPPGVSIFRREKIYELFHRFSNLEGPADPMRVVDFVVLKKVLFRWTMRAAHESSAYVDFIIPSWKDGKKLTEFFQRQFIQETRKLNGSCDIELLRVAGAATAEYCYNLATAVAARCSDELNNLPRDWDDTTVGVFSQSPPNIGSSIVINWFQEKITLSRSVYTNLEERFQGYKSQLLSSIFVCKICYDTKSLLVQGTSMDFSLTQNARDSLYKELKVSLELWSDPFAAFNSPFYGQFFEIDRMFGGRRPFGTTNELFSGGSFSVLAPPDNSLTKSYIQHIYNILETCEGSNFPVSFAVFIRSECLLSQKNPPNEGDLYTLEPKLARSRYVSRAEKLPAGAPFYFSETAGDPQPSTTGSLFVLLQNSSGKNIFPIRNVDILGILRSYETEANIINEPTLTNAFASFPPKMSPLRSHPFVSDPRVSDARFLHGANLPPILPPSPTPPQPSISSNFEPFGLNSIPIGIPLQSNFGNDNSYAVRSGRRRGGLGGFDLVDNGEEDTNNDIDALSGTGDFLHNYNLGRDSFLSGHTDDKDLVESISLMGIDRSSTGFHPTTNRPRGPLG